MNVGVFKMVRFYIGIKGWGVKLIVELVIRKYLLIKKEEF